MWEQFTGGLDAVFGVTAKLAGWGCGTLVVLYFGLMLVGGLLSSCRDDSPPKPPLPVHVSFRTSALGKGMVLKLQNTSQSAIKDLSFTITSQGGRKVGQISRVLRKPLEPQESFEVGWVELDGWELSPGETVHVWVPGGAYAPVEVTVPSQGAGQLSCRSFAE